MKHDSDILKRIKSYFMRRRSSKEAYEFEREMERDNFLYEAMEGYEDMLTSDIQQALDELDDRLDEKSRRAGFVFSWQAAAIAFTVAIGTSLFVMLGGNDEEPATAGSETTSGEEYNPRKGTRRYNIMDNDPAYALQKRDSTTSDSPEEISITADIDVAAVDVSQPSEDPVEAVLAPEQKQESGDLDETDEGEIVMLDEAEVEDVEQDAVMDLTQDEPEPTSLQGVAVTSQDDVKSLSSIDAEEINTRSAAKRRLSEENQREEEAVSAPSPEGGMNAYQAYLKNNLQRSSGMPTGKVTLSFEFDRSGRPKDVRVEKSLCTACDAEAKRLIDQGPKWEASDRKERVTITVDFK